ncbi:P-loop containing nucleoside triphosphate hydrolase protein [Xylariales sp. PMI_506]|nr:P-loop containing nucleoside triphosphate hydrolase protein [Xylariales sp. PMI_506]
MAIAAVLTTLAVRLRSGSGFTGASLVTLMSLGETLTNIVLQYKRLETSIGAIGRLKTFSDTVKAEDREHEVIFPPEEWPQRGVIEFKSVSASYDFQSAHNDGPDEASANLTLREISLTIHAGEKVAICGRTGSGKSSLMALILKLLDPLPGTPNAAVQMDGVALDQVARQTLQARILAVPQDAVFPPDDSNFQANLDPFDLSTADECRVVLEAVGLWAFVEDRGGLAAGLTSGTLSQGQRQLFSLARVVLRRRQRSKNNTTAGGGVLLLDEVSSSVDLETERMIQRVIRAEFFAYTVVAIIHRLDMMMDFDRILVMDEGEFIEVGNPLELTREDSRFRDLSMDGRKSLNG